MPKGHNFKLTLRKIRVFLLEAVNFCCVSVHVLQRANESEANTFLCIRKKPQNDVIRKITQ